MNAKKHGKRLKHRGLLKVNPSIEEARKHLSKAEHDFDGITQFREIRFSDWSMSAGSENQPLLVNRPAACSLKKRNGDFFSELK